VAEIFALAAMGSAIGWPQALLLMLATSLLGVAVLRHPGRARINRMHEAVAQRGIGGLAAGGDAFLTVTAGVLLLIPGFMTDAAGVILLLPPVRRWIGGRFLRFVRTSTGTPGVVDLKEDEWKQVPEPRLSDRRPPNEPS
jgi:UPF0716 protein FxsA